jgi:hypothetical protein
LIKGGLYENKNSVKFVFFDILVSFFKLDYRFGFIPGGSGIIRGKYHRDGGIGQTFSGND